MNEKDTIDLFTDLHHVLPVLDESPTVTKDEWKKASKNIIDEIGLDLWLDKILESMSQIVAELKEDKEPSR